MVWAIELSNTAEADDDLTYANDSGSLCGDPDDCPAWATNGAVCRGSRYPAPASRRSLDRRAGRTSSDPYEPVRNWPKPMSDSLPNHEKFTWSTAMDVFAETPNRVFLVQKGELARIDKRPETKWIPEFGPGLQFPVFRLPLRQAGAGAGSNPLDPPADGRAGVDWRWEHCIVVVDAEGKIIEDWTQWDKLFTRPHDVEISPYDPRGTCGSWTRRDMRSTSSATTERSCC